MNEKQYEINNLLLRSNDFIFICQFNVTSMFEKDVDIILGSTWIETLGTFLLNVKQKIFDILLKEEDDNIARLYNEVMLRISFITRPKDALYVISQDN